MKDIFQEKKERKHALDQEKSKIQENMIENNKKKL